MSNTILSSTPASIVSSGEGTPSSVALPGNSSNEFRDAFFLLMPQLRALPEEQLRPINRDVMTTVTTVLGSIERVNAMRDALVAALPQFDLAQLDQLRLQCFALSYAQATANPPPPLSAEDLAALGTQGSTLRDKLLRDGLYLDSYRLLDGRRLADIKVQPGYRTIATDLLTIVSVFDENWASIEGKTLVTRDEIDQGVVLARRLIQGVSVREQRAEALGEVAELRQRAFSLVVQSYDSLRRAVTYLFWDDPERIESVCPSLYSSRRASKRPARDEDEKTPNDGSPAPSPAPSPAHESKDHAGTSPVVTGDAVNRLPGGNPFQV